MANTYLVLGLIVLAVSAFAFLLGVIFLGIPLFIVFLVFMFLFYRTSATRVNKKVSNITYDGIIDVGISKIKRGTFYIERDKFISVMEKISDIVSSQGSMPEFGIDALYLNFNTQSRAESIAKAINERGVKASSLQERANWKVKIDFS